MSFTDILKAVLQNSESPVASSTNRRSRDLAKGTEPVDVTPIGHSVDPKEPESVYRKPSIFSPSSEYADDASDDDDDEDDDSDRDGDVSEDPLKAD
jgi:hypothetical protein